MLPPAKAGRLAPFFLLPRVSILLPRLLDEAIVALLSMVALWLIPNRKPPVVFIVVFAAGALFDFVLRRYLHKL